MKYNSIAEVNIRLNLTLTESENIIMDIKQLNKAQQVEQAYDVAWDNDSSIEGCYALAVAAARELGGVKIAPSATLTFVFDDSSSAYIMYSGVYVVG